jgi:hypothetical protein
VLAWKRIRQVVGSRALGGGRGVIGRPASALAAGGGMAANSEGGIVRKTLARGVMASRRRAVVAGAVALLAGAGALAGPSTAAAAPPVTVDCSSASLQTAIDNAAPGTRLLVIGTCTGQFTIGKNLSLLGQGRSGAVLDASGALWSLQVNPGAMVSVSNLTITGADGQGIDNRGTLSLTGSTVSDNRGFDGGGIDNSGSLTVRASTVTRNTASFGAGGIASIDRPELPTPRLTVQDSTVSDNYGEYGAGGISSGGDVSMTLSNTRVTGNTSRTGAGGILAGGETTLNDSTVSGNTTQFNGGGIFVNIFADDGNTLTLNNTTISGNTAGQSGGGIANFFSAPVVLRRSTVTNNTPDNCSTPGSVPGCSG